MKKYLEKIIKNTRAKIQKLEKAQIESESKEERAELGATLVTLRDELNEAEENLAGIKEQEEEKEEERQAENDEESNKANERSLQMVGTYHMRDGVALMDNLEQREKEQEKVFEQRGKDLKEKRSVTVEAGNLLLPQHQGKQLNDTFKQVSTLVDMVDTENLQGGESYKEAYVKSYGIGGVTGEGKPYAQAEPEFGYATMSKVKVTAYAEISEEVKKLPNIDYAKKVQDACMIALKKKLSQQIIAGKGAGNEGKEDELVGIFSNPVAIDETKDLDIETIDINTLDEIIFSFGGEEDVETQAGTIFNKNTIKDLSKIRKTNGEKEYDIDVKNRTINTIPYSVNSNVPAFATATAGEFIGAYGDLKGYKVVTFSPVEIAESTDYKFKDGMICYKANVFVAGNVIKQDAFLRLKKKTA